MTTTINNGSRQATITEINGCYEVWVGFTDNQGGTIPARFFKRFSTCSQTFKTLKAATQAATKFIAR